MSVFMPDVIVISSDEEDDGDAGRNLDEGLESEHDSRYIELDDHESDKEKGNEEEFLDNCDERCHRSDVFNQGGSDLQELSLIECKTYLRKHGIRVTGSKEECILRMKEHGRIKDGSGESLYPISSFPINCTGDACRGDVVLFKQNLYNSQGNIIGRRTVAGRILEESYGASTQHTFSVEVLWSKCSEKLDPLSILLVKGRNLYRFGTFRQPWESEEERLKVLREKHERGKAARLKRKLRETEFASGDDKCTKRQKVYHRGPYQSECITRIDRQDDVNNYTTAHSQAEWFQNVGLERSMQLTNHLDPNGFMYPDQYLQEALLSFSYDRSLLPNNLLPFGFMGYSTNNNGHQGPNQAFYQPPDYHHQTHERPVHRSADEIAKSRFPKSSFSINCTGDARNGDVVLFEQQVYLGGITKGKKRTVAGRIVKVRQCESKDEHKFLIKVLWITPSINNPRRSTLLVRSRNLYKFGTFRQPWKNEANRSKMFEEKHGPVTCKRKLKKTDIASNKNKGAKRQKVSDNGTSQGKKQIQKAKQKSPKKKGASATPVKETRKQIQKAKQKSSKKTKGANATPVKETRTGHKKKAKVKKSKQKTFHSDPIPNPNTKTNLNPSLSINPNLISVTSVNHNTYQNPNLNTLQKPNPNLNTPSNPNSNTRSNPKPNTHSNPNPNKRSKPNPNKRSNPNPNKRSNPNANKRSNPSANKPSNPNTSIHPNPHSDPHPNLNANPNANKPSNLNVNRQSHPSANKPLNANVNKQSSLSANKPSTPNTSTHPNPYPNMDPHPNPNSYICPDHQLQEPPYNRTFMPNPPPAWYSHNQPPFWLPGYGGQWGPNHAFIQPPDYYAYNQLIVRRLIHFWYWQQVQPR